MIYNNFKKLSEKLGKYVINTVVLGATMLSANAVFANDYPVVNVALNGRAVYYETTDPVIINDRTMVPIRETADLFGITTEWNAETSTMTFTKGTTKAVHKLGTMEITIDGSVKTYDTASTIIDDYTVMPVRMVADVINAEVDWNQDSRTVLINSSTVLNIVGVLVDREVVDLGVEVNMEIITNTNVSKLQILDNSGNVVHETKDYIKDAISRTFSVIFTPKVDTDGPTTWQVVPGNATAFYPAVAYDFELSVLPLLKIKNYEVNNVKNNEQDVTEIVIQADMYTENVKVTNDYNDEIVYLSEFTNHTNTRLFTLTLPNNDLDVDVTYTFQLGKGSVYANETLDVEITANMQKNEMQFHVIDSEIVRTDKTSLVNATVITSKDIEALAVLNYKGEIVRPQLTLDALETTMGLSNDGPTLLQEGWNEFQLVFDLNAIDGADVQLYGFDLNGNQAVITFNPYQQPTYVADIIKAEHFGTNLFPGSKISLNITTNKTVYEIWITDPNGNIVAKQYNSTAYYYNEYMNMWNIPIDVYYTGNYVINSRYTDRDVETARKLLPIELTD